MKIFIKTYGCQANISDSEQLAGLLNQEHEIVDSIEESELIIVNTCSVKNKTQSKEIEFIKNIPKNKSLFVGGCLTKTLDIRKYRKEIDLVFDTNSLTKIPNEIDSKGDLFSEEKENKINLPKIRKDKDIARIVIQEGCLNKCTFCATKLARGNLKSYRIGDIKREVEKAVNDGCKKIYLTGQDLGCYGFDIKTNLPELLNELVNVDGEFKIRIGMMNPWHVTKILDKLIESYKNPKIMKFLHIPIQSGSERILKHMKRVHTVEAFNEIVKRFREEIPEIDIASDIIVGYPEETNEDFEDTLNLIRDIKPNVLNISTFASRPRTEAHKLKKISSEEIKRRSMITTKIFKEIKMKN
ncbi:tRNA (N(6)-L-threonylcarbamoyladenosine(37)-C(2))-methylthiotransferase [Candidatus Woesearchaeota archaeon]|nr:tRNA (N(6)-L-threonylcarbamoyladenosine(37)-C(2))-methylthiotransferase [Candidatus Woesearchaeota archaeon]